MNLKLQLFNFKNQLNIDQLDVSRIAQIHLECMDNMSEKEYYNSLTESLKTYTYYKEVKELLESVEAEIETKPLIMELKHVYKIVERSNHGELYRSALVKILEIINKPDDDSRMESILNELAMYDYIPQIKQFMMNLTKSPVERQNLVNSGKANKVYTLVEKTENGHMTYIGDRWFLVSESEIKQVMPDDYIKDEKKIRDIRTLEQVMQYAEIADDRISLQIDENLKIGVSTKTGDLYLNEEKLDKETTPEMLFNSPIVPYLKRNYYVLVEAIMNNLNKFMELDVALKVSNMLNPFLENYVFNYKDKMYVYSKDSRYGTRFMAYESVSELIHDIRKELDYDLTHFYENKLSKELKQLRALEDKEMTINMKLKDVNESIVMINESELATEKEMQLALNNLLVYKHKLTKQLNLVKEDKSKFRRSLI